ncbi:MAG: NADH-quinone oxidoreductase subunit F, partial [Oscillospiraceae bacterium]|nr:NADH-quinone oxidoreductase subunit F [Oscillospiraceae bacterium]
MCASLQNTVGLREAGAEKIRVVVGMATCGLASGAGPVMEELKKAVAELGLTNVELVPTGCIGICQFEPIVEVMAPGEKKVTYVKMTPDKAREVAQKHLQGGKALGKYTLTCVDAEGELDDEAPVTYLDDVPFFAKQLRIALQNCGVIDPENIDEYIARGGYQALGKALTEMTPDGVIDEISASGLRGRGGAGFPTGTKWKFACANRGQVQKYVCCNADEGDPGAFMDRSLLEGDPHAILEAMAIAGYAIGADQGYIYVRAEYPLAVAHLDTAIKQAHEYGLLGKNIFGTGFNFDIGLRLGAGAFVCGEETALMTSIEG